MYYHEKNSLVLIAGKEFYSIPKSEIQNSLCAVESWGVHVVTWIEILE